MYRVIEAPATCPNHGAQKQVFHVNGKVGQLFKLNQNNLEIPEVNKLATHRLIVDS